MPRLPQPGGDAGNWGSILNDYLSQTHAADGTLKPNSVGSSQLQANSITSSTISPGAVTAAKVAADVATQARLDAVAATKVNVTDLGAAGGVAMLDGTGKVPSSQLPSYVDDVVEAANIAAFPGTGETGKIYVAVDTGKAYRWSGSTYTEVSAGATFTERGVWITGTSYVIGDWVTVTVSGQPRRYVAKTAHTAGATFSADIAANWIPTDSDVSGIYATFTRASAIANQSRPWGNGLLVATRCHTPKAQDATSGITSRTRHTLIGKPTDIRLVYANILPNGGGAGEDPTRTLSVVKAAIELTSQYNTKILPVTFKGLLSGVIDPGGTLVSDPIGVDLSGMVGTPYMYVRTYATTSDGSALLRTHLADASRGEATGTGDLTGVAAGAVNGGASSAYGPTAIVGQPSTNIPQVGLVGDSRVNSAGDNNPTEVSYLVRALNDSYAYINTALNGDRGLWYGLPIGHYRRAPFTNSCTHVFANYGINDILQGAGATDTGARLNMLSAWWVHARRGSKVYANTMEPVTNSTDAWATTGNQSIANVGQNTVRIACNNWLRDGAPIVLTGATGIYGNNGTPQTIGATGAGVLRAGDIGHPLAGWFDAADAVESSRDSGIWKSGHTSDGLHANSTGNVAMAAVVPVASITVPA